MTIINLSLPKTGTTSLETFFLNIGKKVAGGDWRNYRTNYLISLAINNKFDEIIKISKKYDFCSDLPYGGFKIHEKFYHNKNFSFILIRRNSLNWHNFLKNMVISKTNKDSNFVQQLNEFYHAGRYGFCNWLRIFANNDYSEKNLINMYDSYYDKCAKFLKKNNCNFYYDELENINIKNLKKKFNIQSDEQLSHINIGKY